MIGGRKRERILSCARCEDDAALDPARWYPADFTISGCRDLIARVRHRPIGREPFKVKEQDETRGGVRIGNGEPDELRSATDNARLFGRLGRVVTRKLALRAVVPVRHQTTSARRYRAETVDAAAPPVIVSVATYT